MSIPILFSRKNWQGYAALFLVSNVLEFEFKIQVIFDNITQDVEKYFPCSDFHSIIKSNILFGIEHLSEVHIISKSLLY